MLGGGGEGSEGEQGSPGVLLAKSSRVVSGPSLALFLVMCKEGCRGAVNFPNSVAFDI